MKTAWINCIPVKGEAARALKEKYPEINSLEVMTPKWIWSEQPRFDQVKALNENYDLVAGVFPPYTLETIRQYKIKNYKKTDRFAIWVMPAWGPEPGKEQCQWFVVG
jgi:hypothetical protein